MEQRLLPLWTSNKCTTYTEAQEFCVKRYALSGPQLIRAVSQHLDMLATSVGDTKVLYSLNDLAIDLSTLNPEWNEFSMAVFESILFTKSAGLITTVFENTLQRLNSGKAN